MEKGDYLKHIKATFKIEEIEQVLNKLSSLKVLIIGDTIIDEYCFVEPRGGAIKDPMCTVDYLEEETYAGGILAIANHVSNFVDNITVVTLIGDQMNYKDYILSNLNDNIKLKSFVKSDSPTTRKRRYISKVRNEKLFMIEYFNDLPVDKELEKEIVNYLEQGLPQYDLVIVADYGHGFINEKIIDILDKKAKYLAVNVQTNSANLGFNYVTKYHSPSFLSMDGTELQFAVGDRHNKIPNLMNKLHEKKGFNNFLVTMGKEGVAYFKGEKIYYGSALTTNVRDIVGAGDAVFSIASLLSYQGCHDELIPFMANAVGGVAVQIMGNKESVTKGALLSFIKDTYKETEESDVSNYFSSISRTLEVLNKGSVNTFVQLLLQTYNQGGVVYVFGNGGSGATASHFCGDLVMGVSCGLDKRFKAVCLNDNVPAMMAIANDISYDDIFIEQLKNFLNPEDLVVGISGSGNSVNVVKGLEYANLLGAKTVAICGYKGGKIKDIAQLSVHAEINDMEITEDVHNLIITHCVKRLLSKELKNNNLGHTRIQRERTY